MPVLALNDVKDWLAITDASQDTRLNNLIARVEEWFTAQTDRYFGPVQQHIHVLSGRGVSHIWVPDKIDNLDSTSIQIRADTNSAWGTVIENSNLELETINGSRGPVRIYRRNADWPRGVRNIRLAYDFGYAEGEGPGEVEQALLLVIAHLHQKIAAKNIKSASIGPLKVVYTQDEKMPKALVDVLERWTRLAL